MKRDKRFAFKTIKGGKSWWDYRSSSSFLWDKIVEALLEERDFIAEDREKEIRIEYINGVFSVFAAGKNPGGSIPDSQQAPASEQSILFSSVAQELSEALRNLHQRESK